MHAKEILEGLRAIDKFKEWRENNPEAKLVHLFILLEPGTEVKYDVGFYDASKPLMTSFVIDDSMKDVDMSETDEIFTKEDTKINPLDEDKIKLSFKEAFEISHKIQKDKYSPHEPMKEIVILQNLDIGQVWNITYITKSFQTLNIKIDAETGKVLEDKLHQIFSFDK